jgi:hypothetical protein
MLKSFFTRVGKNVDVHGSGIVAGRLSACRTCGGRGVGFELRLLRECVAPQGVAGRDIPPIAGHRVTKVRIVWGILILYGVHSLTEIHLQYLSVIAEIVPNSPYEGEAPGARRLFQKDNLCRDAIHVLL